MNRWTPKATLIVAGVAVAGLWWLRYEAAQTARQVGEAVNPANSENVFNRTFEAMYRSVTGSQGTPGTDLYDFFHPEQPWN